MPDKMAATNGIREKASGLPFALRYKELILLSDGLGYTVLLLFRSAVKAFFFFATKTTAGLPNTNWIHTQHARREKKNIFQIDFPGWICKNLIYPPMLAGCMRIV